MQGRLSSPNLIPSSFLLCLRVSRMLVLFIFRHNGSDQTVREAMPFACYKDRLQTSCARTNLVTHKQKKCVSLSRLLLHQVTVNDQFDHFHFRRVLQPIADRTPGERFDLLRILTYPPGIGTPQHGRKKKQ